MTPARQDRSEHCRDEYTLTSLGVTHLASPASCYGMAALRPWSDQRDLIHSIDVFVTALASSTVPPLPPPRSEGKERESGGRSVRFPMRRAMLAVSMT